MEKIQISGSPGLLSLSRKLDAGKKGYATTATNVIVRRQGIYEPRPGLEAFGATQASVDRLIFDPTNGQVLRASTSANVLQKWDGAAWTDIDTARKYAGSASYQQFTTLLSNEGLRLLNTANTATQIGYVPVAAAPSVSDPLIYPSPWLASGATVLYAVTWGRKDINNTYFEGAPSGVTTFTNTTSVSVNPAVYIPIPADITPTYFYRIYRSRASAAGTVPNYELFCVYEDYPTSAEIIARETVGLVDEVQDGGGGESLYTNPGLDGIEQSNNPCECALDSSGFGDICTFNESVFASNYLPLSNLQLTLLGVAVGNGWGQYSSTLPVAAPFGTSALVNGSANVTVTSTERLRVGMYLTHASITDGTRIQSITNATTFVMSAPATGTNATADVSYSDYLQLGNEIYTSATGTPPGAFTFRAVVPSATITVEQAIRTTVDYLVAAINLNSLLFRATVISGPDTFPGAFLVTALSDRASTYTAVAARGEAFSPNIGTAQTILSLQDRSAITWSKDGEPLAWPAENKLNVPAGGIVLGICALQEIVVVAASNGFHRITGTYGDYAITPINVSHTPLWSSSNPGYGIVAVDGIAYAMTTRGFAAINETSVAVLDNTPAKLVNYSLPGTGYRLSSHQADGFVFVPTDTTTFVYNTRTGSWTEWDKPYEAGVYDPVARTMNLHSRGSSVNTTYRTRSAQYSATSYYDTSAAATISSVSATTITVNALPSGFSAGDIVVQGGTIGVVTEVVSSTVLALSNSASFSAGACTLYVGYNCSIAYCPTGVAFGSRKLFYSGDVVLDGADVISGYNNSTASQRVTVSFTSDKADTDPDSSTSTVPLPNQPSYHRFLVSPANKRASVIAPTVSWRACYNQLRLAGVDINYTPESDRTGRGVG